MIGTAVCFGVGSLIVVNIGFPRATGYGFGLKAWNLTGTILGAVTWVRFSGTAQENGRVDRRTFSALLGGEPLFRFCFYGRREIIGELRPR